MPEEFNFDYDLLTEHNISAYFTAKNVKQVCPMCSNTYWALSPKRKSRVAHLRVYPEDAEARQKYSLPCLYIVCKNCGFVWLTAVDDIMTWVRENVGGADASGTS